MEKSFGVKVAHSSGRVQCNFHTQIPCDGFRAEDQLFQTPAFDVLQYKLKKKKKTNKKIDKLSKND